MATETGLDSALGAVAALLARGLPFEHIEAIIAGLGLGRDAEALLWLFAWCEGQPAELREIIGADDTPA